MTEDIVRLHITPLSPDLLPAIAGPLLESVSNTVSYHSVQTFPEKSYGYIELPVMEANKVKKKLNGAILKGKKIKVEDARPKKRHATEDLDTESDPRPRRTKKAKNEEDNLDGREISPERKVKRGWTETPAEKQVKSKKSKSKRPTSQYTDKEEVLFRTQVPPNKEEVSKSSKSKKKEKGRERVVHEFEKSTPQPSFLKNNVGGAATTAEYVEGKGWLDKDGNVVEPEKRRSIRKSRSGPEDKVLAPLDQVPAQSEEPAEAPANHKEVDEVQGSSNDGTREEEAEVGESTLIPVPNVEPPTPTSTDDVHPLEALFKKPSKPTSQDVAKPSLEIQTSFSFGVNEDDIEEEEEAFHVPLTPFSSQDQRSRGIRSAAPTPDTAHPSRFSSYSRSESLEAEDADISEDAKRLESNTEANGSTESEFAKKFWEKRGENNRAWKARRRAVLKEKRQRENRARRPRNW